MDFSHAVPGCWFLHHSAQSPDCRVDIKSSSSVKMRLSFFCFLFSSCICSHACICVHMRVCVWRSGLDAGHLPRSLSYVLGIGPFTEFGAHWQDVFSTFPTLGSLDSTARFHMATTASGPRAGSKPTLLTARLPGSIGSFENSLFSLMNMALTLFLGRNGKSSSPSLC